MSKRTGRPRGRPRLQPEGEPSHLNIRLPTDLHDRIARRAFADGKQVTTFARELLAEGLDRRDLEASR